MAGRLLLVDDEAALVELIKKYLERLDYQVDATTSPAEALALFERNPDGYALVLTDLTLPGMSGSDMLALMHVRRPGLPAIISSGYPYEPVSKNVSFLQKPYVPKMLGDMIAKKLTS